MMHFASKTIFGWPATIALLILVLLGVYIPKFTSLWIGETIEHAVDTRCYEAPGPISETCARLRSADQQIEILKKQVQVLNTQVIQQRNEQQQLAEETEEIQGKVRSLQAAVPAVPAVSTATTATTADEELD